MLPKDTVGEYDDWHIGWRLSAERSNNAYLEALLRAA
jgi:hypothetical protein